MSAGDLKKYFYISFIHLKNQPVYVNRNRMRHRPFKLFIANTVIDSEIFCLVLEIINSNQEFWLFLEICKILAYRSFYLI